MNEKSIFPLKRYVLVAWDNYYPAGGLGNLRGSFDTIPEARALYNEERDKFGDYDYAEVYDTQTGERVWPGAGRLDRGRSHR